MAPTESTESNTTTGEASGLDSIPEVSFSTSLTSTGLIIEAEAAVEREKVPDSIKIGDIKYIFDLLHTLRPKHVLDIRSEDWSYSQLCEMEEWIKISTTLLHELCKTNRLAVIQREAERIGLGRNMRNYLEKREPFIRRKTELSPETLFGKFITLFTNN